LHPTYGSCNLAGLTVSVTTTGCNVVFATAATKKAAVTIECEEGKEVIVKDKAGIGCEVTLKAQKPGGAVSFTNQGEKTGRTVLAAANLENGVYNWTAGCPNAKEKAGSNTNATYTGSIVLKGSNSKGESVGFSVT
jgi:hypothetical protein